MPPKRDLWVLVGVFAAIALVVFSLYATGVIKIVVDTSVYIQCL